MKIVKDETSFMRDNVPALDVDVTAVVSPTYKKALEDREAIRARIKKELKDKEARKEPVLGTKADKLTLGESLFEDFNEEKKLNEIEETEDASDTVVAYKLHDSEEAAYGQDYWHWYLDDDGLYGRDGKDGIIILDDRGGIYKNYTSKSDDVIESAISEREENEKDVDALTRLFGKKYKKFGKNGYSQGDYFTCYYPEGEFDIEYLDELGSLALGGYSIYRIKDERFEGETEIDDTIAVYDLDRGPYKTDEEKIADKLGIKKEQVVIKKPRMTWTYDESLTESLSRADYEDGEKLTVKDILKAPVGWYWVGDGFEIVVVGRNKLYTDDGCQTVAEYVEGMIDSYSDNTLLTDICEENDFGIYDKKDLEDYKKAYAEEMNESLKKGKKIDEALVEIDDDEILDMLMNRLEEYWHPDKDTYDLYEKMYQNYLDNGVFEGAKLNIAEIVDNDWVNYCDVVSEGDDYFEECKKAYADGDYEISNENGGYIGNIEAVDDEENPTMFLIRLG